MALSVRPDWRVLAFTAAMSLVACLVSGLAPAVQAVRVDVNPALKAVRAHGSRRLGQVLVIAQLAISMVLIVGATLFVGTLVRLYAVDRGFDGNGVLSLSLRSSRPYTDERGKAVKHALIERLRALPGIRAGSATQVLPVSGDLWAKDIQVEGYMFRSNEADSVAFNVIGPAYFATLGTPLVSGREFDDRDQQQSPKVATVNETFARCFFGAGPALGRHVTTAGVTYEIVGVGRDAKYRNLRDPVMKTMYIPWTQRDGDQPTQYKFQARAAAGDPLRFAPIVERLVRDVDPALHVRATYSYATLVDRSLVTERIMAMLGGASGLLALIDTRSDRLGCPQFPSRSSRALADGVVHQLRRLSLRHGADVRASRARRTNRLQLSPLPEDQLDETIVLTAEMMASTDRFGADPRIR